MTIEKILEHVIDKQDFEDWLKHPVTKDIMESLRVRYEALEKTLSTTIPLDDRGHHMQLYHVGLKNAYEEIINIKFEDFDFSDK